MAVVFIAEKYEQHRKVLDSHKKLSTWCRCVKGKHCVKLFSDFNSLREEIFALIMGGGNEDIFIKCVK